MFTFVNIVNGISVKTENKNRSSSNVIATDEKNNNLKDDTDGTITVEFLKKCRKIAKIISSTDTSSLGLHPSVYFYSQYNGYHKISSFFAITALILEFEKNKQLYKDFINVREKFEAFLLTHDYFSSQIVRKYRDALNSYEHLKSYYLLVIRKILEGKTENEIIDEIIKDSEFKYLKKEIEKETESEEIDFANSKKSAIFIKEALNSCLKCKICNGYIHRNSISIDHNIRKRDGGMGSIENGQLTHPYCNSTIKN
ncbi:HNH endonuclease [Methanosarcina sp. MSH10X1]|uniref:HNH endonuclease n=1 Tax=Methanosarcina sp. MSH10X1 TaxID=2507075 RepID=UPI00197C2081|nr:HNH endonuclease signature motif containing protein [Methanosarcina sp. MSH10X1]